MMAADAAEAIKRFLGESCEPELLEPGEPPYPLRDGSYALETRAGRLTLQVWDDARTLVRRIARVAQEKPGKLELVVLRFGGQEGRMALIDRARTPAHEERRAVRLVFRERMRRHLARQFPGWRIAELSTEPNLEESLSPAYPRALLRRGTTAWAAIGAPPEPGADHGLLTFGLIWLDYLRRRELQLSVEGLALFLPEDAALTTCLRLGCLNSRAARFAVFLCSEHGHEDPVDPRDVGNLDTDLEPCSSLATALSPETALLVEKLAAIPGVETHPRGAALSLRVRGLEFARATAQELRFGLERHTRATPYNIAEAAALAREIARMRSATPQDRENPLFRLRPEGWLETEVRRHLQSIDPTLRAQPVYGQVPAMAGGERGVLDLLAVDHSGRLAVLELKASEDIHLPFQALDYWMRVRRHAERGDFTARGYFPGLALRREWPRLLLVAPALHFHPRTETLLRYLHPEIHVERIGLGVEWRQGPKVAFRLLGAERPR